jgi:light-regulated signal transduction histidine kinase (bacteriophytochrome)
MDSNLRRGGQCRYCGNILLTLVFLRLHCYKYTKNFILALQPVVPTMDADGHTTTYAHLNQRLHTRHAFKIYKICATHYSQPLRQSGYTAPMEGR